MNEHLPQPTKDFETTRDADEETLNESHGEQFNFPPEQIAPFDNATLEAVARDVTAVLEEEALKNISPDELAKADQHGVLQNFFEGRREAVCKILKNIILATAVGAPAVASADHNVWDDIGGGRQGNYTQMTPAQQAADRAQWQANLNAQAAQREANRQASEAQWMANQNAQAAQYEANRQALNAQEQAQWNAQVAQRQAQHGGGQYGYGNHGHGHGSPSARIIGGAAYGAGHEAGHIIQEEIYKIFNHQY